MPGGSMTRASSAVASGLDEWLIRRPVWSLLLAIYALAVILSLTAGYVFFFRSRVEFLDYDEWEYWQLSGSLLGGGFDDPGRRTAGFPALLAALRLVADDLNFVQPAVAALASTAPPLLAFALLKAGAGRLAAVLAGVALALWPPHLFLSVSLYSEALTLPLLLVFLAFLPRKESGRRSLLAWVACGILLGVIAHFRTMYQLFVPVLLVMLIFEWKAWRPAVARWALVVSGFLAAVLPWSAYVSDKAGRPILLTANGGETLAGGLTPRLLQMETSIQQLERRTAYTGPGKWLPIEQTGYLSARETQLPYMEQDGLLKERTLNWVWSNPDDAAYLVMRKLAYQWGIYPFWQHDTKQILFGNLPIIVLALLFLLVAAKQPAAFAIGARFWLMPLFVIGVAVVSWGSWRFRHPADAAMIAVVATAASLWLAGARGRVQDAISDQGEPRRA